MNDFFFFLQQSSRFKTNLLLVIIIAFLIPNNNYYYQLDLPDHHPVVKDTNYNFLPLSDYPNNYTNISVPYISARSAIIIDADSKTIMWQKNPDLPLLPASITKIITALVVMDHYSLSQIITITPQDVDVVGQTMELQAGEQITVENLLYGLLVQSGNDAANTLSLHFTQGRDQFIVAMNNKADQLNLSNTQFKNSIGIDQVGHYTTVHDLAILASHAMNQPLFRQIVSTTDVTITSVDQDISHDLIAINQLLGVVPGLIGVKTGWTQLAGECLVTYTQRQQHRVITVVLASQDRFNDSQQLINWAFSHHQWQSL